MTGAGRKGPAAAPRTACLAVAVALALGAVGASARAEGGDGGVSAAHGYTVALTALTGPDGADLTIDVDAPPGASAVDVLAKIQLKIYDADGSLSDVRNLKDVIADGGVANVELGKIPRDRLVEADVLVRETHTNVARASAKTRLRPDLVVTGVSAPPQTTTSRSIAVVADLEEINGDTGATATATLMLGPTPLAESKQVSLAAGGTASVTFTGVTVPTAVVSELEVVVREAAPAETDATNNDASTTVDVSEHELLRTDVLVPSLGGYGAQFNQHVYAPITNLPPSTFDELETAVKEFEPQLVRLFYNENFEEVGQPRYDPGNIESLRQAVALAQAAGATINITYNPVADARLNPVPHMQRFADALLDLRNRGNTNVVWATVGNEPNGPGQLTLAQWEALYRALDAELRARGLRDEIKLMGGDLVESSGARDHETWFAHMTANMADILDAYSEHIYWWYDTFNLEGAWRFEFRLRDIRELVVDHNPEETRRPPYIMEFGVRGYNAAPGQPTVTNHAYYEDGTFMRETNVAAFQQLWFNIAAAQQGFVGTSKWDLYWGKYDFTTPPNQSYWMMEPLADDSWRVFPSYHALKLLLATTERGWQIVRVLPWELDDFDPLVRDQPEKELTAYVGPDDFTVVGLDSRGRLLNTASSETVSYSIGGLLPSTTHNLAIWNAAGDGTTSAATQVATSAAGVARFEVPLHAAFALTTVDVP